MASNSWLRSGGWFELVRGGLVLGGLVSLLFLPEVHGSNIGKPAYGVIQNNGVAVASRNILNIVSGGTCADNAPATDCTFSGGGGGSGAPNVSQAFTTATTVTITDNLGTTAKVVQCRDASNVVLEPNTVTITNANTTTVTFLVAQTGVCVVNGSGGNGQAVTSETVSFTVDSSDAVMLCDATGGAVVATLPAAATAGAGRQYTLKKVDAGGNACTFDGSGAETIDGATTLALSAQWAFASIVSNGSAWFVVSQ